MNIRGEGPLTAKVVVVGEAPGMLEAKSGRPFVGTTGVILGKLLAGAGIVRSDCYVTYLIKEQPYKNDVGIFAKVGKSHISTTERYDDHENALAEELSKLPNVNIIITLGELAMWALTRERTVNKRRGSFYSSTLVPGKKVMPVVDLTTTLKDEQLLRLTTIDFNKVREDKEFPELRLPERDIILRPSFEQAMSYIEKCHDYGEVATDIEVDIKIMEMTCISLSYAPNSAISIPFSEGTANYYPIDQEMAIWRALAKLFTNPDVRKVGQNIIFDSTFIFRKYGILIAPVQDTMIAQAILMPDFKKGLDIITSLYTREPYYKDEGKTHIKMGTVSDSFWRYNALDSCVCLEAWQVLQRELVKNGMWAVYEHQRNLIHPLIWMGEHGILVDQAGREKAASEEREEALRLATRLHELMPTVENLNSTQQLMEHFYKVKRIKPYINRKTHKPTLDVDALKRLSKPTTTRGALEEARLIARYRALKKDISTYLESDIDKDNRLRMSFNPVGTKQGRLSSSKSIFGTGMNSQNLPSSMKKYLLADEGYVQYNMDLAKAENRIVAYIAPDVSMIKAFEQDIDLHSQTGALISGIPIEDIIQQDNNGIPCNLGDGSKTWRFWGKKANHSLNYDFGVKAFAYLYEISERDAQFIVESYHRAYPGVRKYHGWVQESLQKNRTLVNPMGRPRKFLGKWGDSLFKEAYSYTPQSTVADIINRWGINTVWNGRNGWAEHVCLMNQVHDSIVFQIPVSVGWQYHLSVLLTIKETLEQVMSFRGREFYIPVDIEMGLAAKPMHKVKSLTTESLQEIWEKINGPRNMDS